ncbi:MAG: Translation initiation factor IF-3 [candidate division CPR1 bacterium GW2011_GWA2_42_17]|uniref:Translation initiation factor IF-3 n=1 Tax=candidate division CPR1 bacterium GW2011_GWA2_42_17 TaxID=1618341 RepID=A0A0G1C2G3_9BACT|nr:MAG: Translation initiation factor IF-3 [candidate division CPR1 bacterium GW2011_GWA2_42_17]
MSIRRHRHRRHKPRIQIAPRARANGFIRAPEVRVIDDEGEHLGVLKLSDALVAAREREMDLVEVDPAANPPVCRIMNYGQFQYELNKKEQKMKARQKKQEIKGVRLSVKIGQNDLAVRLRQALGFFDDGNKINVEIVLRGREKQHLDIAEGVIKKFIESLGEGVMIESPILRQGGRLACVLARKSATPSKKESLKKLNKETTENEA